MTRERNIKVGIRVPVCTRVPEFAEAVALAERCGFDSVTIPDSQLLWRDAYIAMAFAACATQHINLMTAVTNGVTRHPSVVASAFRTIAELAPGRTRLGLGAAWTAAKMVGLRSSNTQELRSIIESMRSLLGGLSTNFGSGDVRLRDPEPVPIVLSALGPKSLALGGEIADGILVMNATSPEVLSDAMAHIDIGVKRANRARKSLPISVVSYTLVTDDASQELRLFKPFCAMMLHATPEPKRRQAGISFVPPERVPGVYPDAAHPENWEGAVEAADAVVPDEVALNFARHFALVGSAEEVAARIVELQGLGVSEIIVNPVSRRDNNYTLPEQEMAQFNAVLSRLRQTSRA